MKLIEINELTKTLNRPKKPKTVSNMFINDLNIGWVIEEMLRTFGLA